MNNNMFNEIADLGLPQELIIDVRPFYYTKDKILLRLYTKDGTYVLIRTPSDDDLSETTAYRLFQESGIPTLPIYKITDRHVMVEDLTNSADWRLARKIDVELYEVGWAVGEWYKKLHDNGLKLIHRPEFSHLSRECDSLTPESILKIGKTLGMETLPIWQLAADAIDDIKDKIGRMAVVLNYNDFYYTNLALSEQDPLQAIIFDYGELRIGMRYSDCRNVVSSMGYDAIEGFYKCYGEPDPIEVILDDAVTDLYALSSVVQRKVFPKWVKQTRKKIGKKEYEKIIIKAKLI